MLNQIILDDVERSCAHLNGNFLRQKSILVTGASGLIGTYILAYIALLNKNGYAIEAYAQSFSPPTNHMQQLINSGNICHLRLDLADPDQYKHLPYAEVIIHSAGYAQPLLFMSNPIATLTINVSATIALAKRLKPGGSFIFISSAEVYCGLTGAMFQEDKIGTTTPYHPRSSYIEGKRSGEAVCSALTSQGIRAISIRLGDIYGPGTRINDTRALNTFIQKGITTQKIELLDKGTARRTYCYASDALELILNILISGKQFIYNVGGPEYVCIADVAKMIGKITDSKVIFPEEGNQVKGAPGVLKLDLSRVMNEFNKKEYLILEEGLERTVAWQRELYLGG